MQNKEIRGTVMRVWMIRVVAALSVPLLGTRDSPHTPGFLGGRQRVRLNCSLPSTAHFDILCFMR